MNGYMRLERVSLSNRFSEVERGSSRRRMDRVRERERARARGERNW